MTVGQAPSAEASERLLDDFASGQGKSALGTSWVGFSDTVMGGISQMRYGFETVHGKPALRLRGRVRLENNGGFIQVALPLAAEGQVLDASGHQGIRLWVVGTPGSYAIHLRTSDHWLPWQYHSAPLPVTPSWRQVDLPFTAFARSGWEVGRLKPEKLRRLGIVAIKQAFDADIAVARLSFY
ncbi:MAG: CIA30 family protein [Candidatus Sericytochromatia bacterium]|nr:CIA30 family protein [Candidatus Sericytochromatia bacterium]